MEQAAETREEVRRFNIQLRAPLIFRLGSFLFNIYHADCDSLIRCDAEPSALCFHEDFKTQNPVLYAFMKISKARSNALLFFKRSRQPMTQSGQSPGQT